MSRSQEAVKKSKEQYELALLDINNYNSRYMEVNIQCPSHFVVICCEKFSVVDSDQGSGAFFTPGSGIGFFLVPRSRIPNPQPLFLKVLSNNFLQRNY